MLQELQNNFLNYCLKGELQEISKEIFSSAEINSEKRLQIYYDAYRLRLIDALMEDYPKLHTLIGDEEFYKLANEYIAAYPSEQTSIRYFGKYLKQILKQDPRYQAHGILAEMAEFEWLLGETLDAADAEILNFNILETIDPNLWPKIKLQFHPSLRYLNCHWDTPEIWLAIEAKEPPREPQKLQKPITWICWRDSLQAHFCSLEPAETNIFHTIINGHDLSEACENLRLDYADTEIPEQLIYGLRKWFNNNLITAVNIG